VTVRGEDSVDELFNVERLVLGASQIAIDISGNAGMAYRLYKAAFDRVPDLPGLGYQMHDLDSGVSLGQVASNFIASPEFQATYGAVSNEQFVTLLYWNVLDRAPELEGLQYHVSRLAAGAIRADILVGFSESPENKANVIGLIEQGMEYVW
jgi:serralysin